MSTVTNAVIVIPSGYHMVGKLCDRLQWLQFNLGQSTFYTTLIQALHASPVPAVRSLVQEIFRLYVCLHGLLALLVRSVGPGCQTPIDYNGTTSAETNDAIAIMNHDGAPSLLFPHLYAHMNAYVVPGLRALFGTMTPTTSVREDIMAQVLVPALAAVESFATRSYNVYCSLLYPSFLVLPAAPLAPASTPLPSWSEEHVEQQ